MKKLEQSLLNYEGISTNEWVSLIQSKFSQIRRPPLSRELHFYADNSSTLSLIIQFNKKNQPKALNIQEGADTKKLYELKEELEEIKEKENLVKFSQRILFSLRPVEGSFNYENKFQIIPLPEKNPRSQNYPLSLKPFILQYSYESIGSRIIDLERSQTKFKNILWLLNLFLNEPIVATYGFNQGQGLWINYFDTENKLQGPVYGLEGYSFDGFKMNIEGLTSFKGNKIQTIKDKDFFQMSPYSGEKLFLPKSIHFFWERFFLLNAKKKEKFLSACYWNYLSKHSYPKSLSMRLLKSVASLEALLPEEKKEKCSKCNKEIGDGIARRIYQLLQGLSLEVDYKTVKRIYALRSNPAHGRAFESELCSSWAMTLNQNDEMNYEHFTNNVASLALINWLVQA